MDYFNMDKGKKTFSINVLRRGSFRWPGRWLAEKRSALGSGFYYCENPECGVVVKKKYTQMDHIVPVIPLDQNTNDVSLDTIADRLYCSPEGFQRLCIDCHKEKSAAENAQRPAGERTKKRKKKNG